MLYIVEKVQGNVQQYLNEMTVDKRVRTLFWQSSKMCCVTLFVLSWWCGLNSSSDGAVRVSCFSTAYTLHAESVHEKSWLSSFGEIIVVYFIQFFSKTPYWRAAYKLIIFTEINIGLCHLPKQSVKATKIYGIAGKLFFSDYTHRMAFLAGWPGTPDRKLHGICTRLWSTEVQRPYHFVSVWQPFWP